jgi:hypothetical protein
MSDKTINPNNEPPMLINFDNLDEKRRFMQHVGTLRGLFTVKLEPRKRQRTLDQNSFYWAAFIPGWLSWYRHNEGDPTITALDAHYALMAAVLPPREILNKETGEIVTSTNHRSSKMTVEEFSVYLDKARIFLWDFANILVMDADDYFEKVA